MKKLLLALLVLSLLPAVASAGLVNSGTIGTYIKWEAYDDLGGGVTRYDVYLDDPADGSASYFLGALGFTGTINQDAAFGALAVNDEVNATTFDGVGGGFTYVKASDSFFFTPFTANTVAPGITDTAPLLPEGFVARTYAITAGSGGGSKLDFVQIAQIVASGSVDVDGTVARLGIVTPASGTMTPIPEPSTFVLLGMGAVGLAFLAKRRKSS
jgi:threonine dehydrogenase-like Zn-dependent dehydrogenase